MTLASKVGLGLAALGTAGMLDAVESAKAERRARCALR
jgi:hypothetical protein